MNHHAFVIERLLAAPVEKVWKAITDREQMKQWYFNIEGFKPEPGFEFTFVGENEGRTFVHLCKITEAIPNKKLGHTWRYKGVEGMSHLSFELFPEGDGTRIRLTHEGLETFPQNQDFRKENFVAGWTEIIGTMLPNYLNKRL